MIHATAIIDPTAKLAKNVEIGAYSVCLLYTSDAADE